MGPEEAKRLYVVQYGGEPEFTAKAIANAGAVVVTLGPGENGPSRGPLDCARALSIVTAATLARVGTFVLLSDFNEGAGGALGGLGGALTRVFAFLSGGRGSTSYSDVREALAQAGEQGKLRYTVVRSGFWDGVPDSYADRSNLVVAPEGKITAGKVRGKSNGRVTSVLLQWQLSRYCMFQRAQRPALLCILFHILPSPHVVHEVVIYSFSRCPPRSLAIKWLACWQTSS